MPASEDAWRGHPHPDGQTQPHHGGDPLPSKRRAGVISVAERRALVDQIFHVLNGSEDIAEMAEELVDRGLRFYAVAPETLAEHDAEVQQVRAEVLGAMESEVYDCNVANGWFEADRTFGDDIALLHSEVSEMLEEFRDHGMEDVTKPHAHIRNCEPSPHAAGDDRCLFGPPKPEGVGSEAADILVRLLDTCKRRGIDLAFEFDRKLKYNWTRGHRHGGKRL